jgi:hypothetical protein
VSFQGLLGKLGDWLGGLTDSEGFDIEIPFTDGTLLSDVLNWADIFGDLVMDAITVSDDTGDGSATAEGGPSFTTLGDLGSLLSGILSNFSYDKDTNALLFDLSFDETIEGIEADLAFGFDLGELAGLETSSTITLTPRLIADMDLGVLLQKPGADFVLATDTLLSDLNGGKGVPIDEGVSDIRVQLRDGTTFEVTFDGATTVGEIVDLLRQAAADAGLAAGWFDAQINTD